MRTHRTILITLAVLFGALQRPALAQFGSSPYDLTARETRTMLMKDTSIVLLDVRSPREYAEERIADTPLMPLQYLERKIAELERYKKKKIIVYCHSGNRSDLAVEILREYGFNAYNMQGGILRWKAERFPVKSGAPK